MQITSGYCPKTWEVSNKLTETTAGNFCAGKKYSSMYSCAANCRYTSSSLNQSICEGLPDKLSYTSGKLDYTTLYLHYACHFMVKKEGGKMVVCLVLLAPSMPCCKVASICIMHGTRVTQQCCIHREQSAVGPIAGASLKVTCGMLADDHGK